MNEWDELARLRVDVPPMSAAATVAGRRRLRAAITREAGTSVPTRGWGRRVLRSAVAVGVLLAAGFIGYQVASPHGGAPTSAASVLRRAADAAEPAVALHPRPGQYVYREVDHVTGALRSRVRSWQSADGSQPGLVTVTGDTGDSSSVTPPYRAGDSLSGAPYSVLGALPTDPDALRRVLEADPMVHTLVTASAGPGQTAAVWNLMRDLVWTVPPRQQAALFRMAAMLPGITVEGSVVDAAGRGGIAVGLFDPALGRIEFVFDPGDYRFLGERIVDNNRPGRVLFNDTLRRTTVVDRSGQTPQ